MASNSAFELGIGLDYQATYNAVLQGFTKIADAVEKQIRITPNIDTADLQKKLQTAFKNVRPLQMQVDAVFANQKGGDAAKLLGADFMAQMQGLYQRRQELQQQLRNSTSDIDKAYNTQHLAEVNAEYRKLLLTYQQATTAANALKEAEAAAVARRADEAAQQEADAYLARDAAQGRQKAQAKWEAFLAEDEKYTAEEISRLYAQDAEELEVEMQLAREHAQKEREYERLFTMQEIEERRRAAREKAQAAAQAAREAAKAERDAEREATAYLVAEERERAAAIARAKADEEARYQAELAKQQERERQAYIDWWSKELDKRDALQKSTEKAAANIGRYITQTVLLGYAINTLRTRLREGLQAVRDIDSALTQLRIVTGASAETLQQYSVNAVEEARASGNAVTDIMKSTETYARLGYSLEDSLKMASVTARYANVASTTTEEATSAMTAILKGFGMSAQDSEHVADILTAVGQKYAISAGELGQALERGGAAMAAAGNTLEESVALLAAANAAVQNPMSVGNAMKTVTLRIRGAKAELEEMGETTDEFVESSSKMRETIQGLSGVDIMKDARTFKSTYEIFTEISAIWDRLSDINQAALLEALGGKRQAAIVASAITNIKDLQGAYETAANAAGTLADANEEYMHSINAQLGVLKTSWQSFVKDLVNSEAIINIVEALSSLINALHSVWESGFIGQGLLGGLGGGLLGLGGVGVATHVAQLLGAGSIATSIAAALPQVAAVAAIIGTLLFAGSKLYQMFGDHSAALDDLIGKYDDETAAVQATEDQLTEKKERLQELNALKNNGKLTTAEERELTLLQQQTTELQRQKELRENSANAAMDEARAEALRQLAEFKDDSYYERLSKTPIDSLIPQRFSPFATTEQTTYKSQLDVLHSMYDQALQAEREYQRARTAEEAQAARDRKEQLMASAEPLYNKFKDIVGALNSEDAEDLLAIQEFEMLTNQATILRDGVQGVANVVDQMVSELDPQTINFLKYFFNNSSINSFENFVNIASENKSLHEFATGLHDIGVSYREIYDILSTNNTLIPSAIVDTPTIARETVEKTIAHFDGLNIIKNAAAETEKYGYITTSTLEKIKKSHAGLQQYLVQTADGYKITTGALESYLSASKQTYVLQLNEAKRAAAAVIEAEGGAKLAYDASTASIITEMNAVIAKLEVDLHAAQLQSITAASAMKVQNARSIYGGVDTTKERSQITAQINASTANVRSIQDAINKARAARQGVHNAEFNLAQADSISASLLRDIDKKANSGSKSGSGNKSSEDKWKKAAEQEIDDLDRLLAMDQINKEKYYTELEAIENYYYKDSAEHEKKYAKEINTIDEKLYKGRQELFSDWLKQQDRLMSEYADKNNYKAQETLTKDILAAIEKRIAETTAYLKKYGLDENHELVQDLRDQWKKYAKDWVDTLCGAYDDYLDYMDDFDLWTGSSMTRNGVVRNLLSELETLYNQGFLTPAEYLDKRNGYAQSIRSDSQDAINTILDAVKELIKADGEDEVEALEAQADAYAEIIDKRKEALALQKKEADHQKSIEEKLKQIAKLQSRIARLSLDDSREAQAKRASLESELSDLQSEVADANNDYAEDALTERLDKEKEAYQDNVEQRKEEIQAELDDEHQLYLKAIKMIESDTGSLYERLHQYAVDHQTEIDGPDSIATAWNTATEALRAYNGQLEVAYKKAGLQDAISISPSSFSDSLGTTTSNSRRFVNLEDIVSRMYNRSVERKQNPKNAATANYHQLNQQDAATLNANGLTVWYDNGWFIKVKGKTIPLYSYYGFPSYHSGGIVGKTAGLTDSEMFAVLKRGELVLNDGQKKNLQSILDTLASTLSVRSVMARMGNRAYNGQESNRASGDTFTFNVTVQSNNTDTASARRFGNEIAEVALERLRTTMNRRGVRA